jgi:hypothetical protein
MNFPKGVSKLKRLIPDINHSNVVDMRLCAMMNKFIVHPIKLDDELHSLGYTEEKDGSINDYVLKKYGQEAVDLINS